MNTNTKVGYIPENLETAARLEKKSRWDDLYSYSKQWTLEEPKNFLPWQTMGFALRKLGRPAEAIVAFRKGLEIGPPPNPVEFMCEVFSVGPLWYGLAHAYNELGKTELSIEAFKEAARIDPKAGDIWNDLGVIYLNINDHKNAGEAFIKAVEADPTNKNSLKNLGILYALCGMQQGVTQIHQRLSKLDGKAARDFMAQARQLLSKP